MLTLEQLTMINFETEFPWQNMPRLDEVQSWEQLRNDNIDSTRLIVKKYGMRMSKSIWMRTSVLSADKLRKHEAGGRLAVPSAAATPTTTSKDALCRLWTTCLSLPFHSMSCVTHFFFLSSLSFFNFHHLTCYYILPQLHLSIQFPNLSWLVFCPYN